MLTPPRERLAALLAVALIAALLAPMPSAAEAAPQPVQVSPTGVYGLNRLVAASLAGGITASSADLAGGVAYIAGEGYAAALNVSSAQLLWTTSIQGAALAAAVESSSRPSMVAVATTQGEVVVLNASSGGVVSTYYVGEDAEIQGVELIRSPDGVKLAVLTGDGYLRVYRVGSPYWLEIGPNPGQEPLRSLAGVAVNGAYPVYNVSGWWNYTIDQLLLLRYAITDPALRPSMALNVYYVNGTDTLPAYTHTGLDLGDGRRLYSTLEVWVSVEPYGVLDPWNSYPATGNATLVIGNLYPGIYRVYAVYNYTIVNSTTGAVLENYCYQGESGLIQLNLSSSATLNITLNQSSACQAPSLGSGSLETLLVLNVTGLPENFTLSSLKPLLIPKPAGSLEPADVVAAVSSGGLPPGWGDYNASGLLVSVYNKQGSSSVVATFLNGTTMEPTPVNASASELLQFEAPVESVAYRPNLSVLYLGTGAGTLYRLQWIPSEGRYVATNSIEATGDEPIVAIEPTPWNVTVAVGSQGTAQAVNETVWQPLWRGGPGYTGLALPLGGAQPIAVYEGPRAPLVVIPGLGAGEAPWLLSASYGLWSTPPLSQVEVNVSVILYTPGGEETLGAGEGSYVEAYRNGVLVAREQLGEGGVAELYLAPGNYTLLVNATEWGAALVNVTINDSQEQFDIILPFREVTISAYTPPGPEPGYALVSGPVEGASISVEPIGVDPEAGILPVATSAAAATDARGQATLVLWAPVEYNITVSKSLYLANTTILAPGGAGNLTLQLLPILYNVSIALVDSDAAAQGVGYTVPNATITIAGPRGQVSLDAPSGVVEVGLPAATLAFTASAPGYLANSTVATISGPSSLVILMEAEVYQLVFNVYMNDTLTGLASGPLAGAQVVVALEDPPLANFSYTAYTNAQGQAVLALRHGVYTLTVEYPGAAVYSATLRVDSAGSVSVVMEPLYSNLEVNLYDSDLYNYSSVPVPNATILLAYEATGRSIAVEAPNGTASLTLPYGVYQVIVQAPYYNTYGPAALYLNSSSEVATILMKPIYYQVVISVYLNDTLTGLASGPLAGAELEVVLSNPQVPQVNLTLYTNNQGVAQALLRYGTYTVTVSHPYAATLQASFTVRGGAAIAISVEPLYSNVTLAAGDSEFYQYGVLAANATFTVTYASTGRSLVVSSESGAASLLLPYGVYEVSASAPYYYPAGPQEVMVAEPSLYTALMLQPIYYQVTIQVQVNDTLTGLASGPLAGAQVVAVLVDPPVPGVNYTASTDQQGVAALQLRHGLYQVIVQHPYTETYTAQLGVSGGTATSVSVEPRYSELTLTLYDSDLYQYGVTVANASVTLTYQATGRSLTLQAPQGVVYATVPYGLYSYTASAPFYYPLGPVEAAVTSGEANIVDYMTPIKYTVELKFVINDSIWGLATGPASGALVNLTLVSPQLPLAPLADYTDAQGRVSFQLRAGTYQVVVTHPIAATGYFYINVGAQESLTFTLHPDYATLNITVADGETGQPIPGSVVTLTYTSMGQRSISLTLDNGSELVTLPPGTYQVQAAEWHYYTSSAQLTLNKAARTGLVVHLQPVKVQVGFYVGSAPVNASGYQLPSRPVGGASVVLEPSDPVLQAVGAPAVSLETGPDGTVSASVRIGSYVVAVSAPNYYGVEDVELITGPRSLEYEITPILYNVTLKLVDPEMLPGHQDVAGVSLTLVSWDGFPVGDTITVNSGETLRLPAGELVFEASKRFYDTRVFNLSVTGNINATVELNATRYQVVVSVDSTFQDWVSGPAVGVDVYLEASEPLKTRVFHATTGADGSALLEVRAGNYTVLLLGPGIGSPIALGEVNVTGNTRVSYTLEAPAVNVTLKILDALAGIPPATGASVEIAYNGPYGSGTLKLTINGTAQLSLPAGSLVVSASADRYQPASVPVSLANASGSIVVSLEPILVPLRVEVVNPDGAPVDGAIVRLTYEIPELSPPPMVTVNGTAEVRGGARIGAYRVTVEPPPSSPLLPAATRLDVGKEGASIKVVLPYKNYTVVFILKDSVTGKLIPFKYTLTLTRSGAGSEKIVYPKEIDVVNGKANATLPYGDYTITLKPASQDYYVIPQSIAIHVEKDNQTFVIAMKPRIYTVSVTVIDDRSRPVAGALVEVVDTKTGATVASQLTDATGSASFNLPYGLYEIRVTHRAYKPASAYMDVPSTTSTTVNVYPTPITALKRLAPLIIGVVGLALLGVVLWRAKEAIAARLAEQEEYF